MKFGIRTPNYKSRLKARTTGKIKRKLKKSVNPLYGKKGMGWVNDPKKALYNKVYNKTTVGVPDPVGIVSSAATKNKSHKNKRAETRPVSTVIKPKNKIVALILCIFLGYLGIHRFYTGKVGTGILWLVTVGCFGIGWIYDIIKIASGTFRDGAGRIIK